MKTLLFLVSFLTVVLSVEGASVSKKDGVVTTRIAGQVITSGYTERSGILVSNPYPDLNMKVKVQIFELTPDAYYGYGRDPLLGTPPKRILGKSKTYEGSGCKFFAPSPGIVMDRGYVEVTATWFDTNGKQVGNSVSNVFSVGCSEIWNFSWSPYQVGFHYEQPRRPRC